MRKPGTIGATNNNNNSNNNSTSSTDAPSSTITIHLKSTRNPTLSLTLPSTPTSTSILDLKERIASEINQPSASADKIRILYQKKPCADSKTVKDVVGDEALSKQEATVEFGVMVMGYTASNLGPQFTEADMKVADKGAEVAEKQGKRKWEFARGVMEGEDFWNELTGWLVERVGDDGFAGEVVEEWRKSWKVGLGKGR